MRAGTWKWPQIGPIGGVLRSPFLFDFAMAGAWTLAGLRVPGADEAIAVELQSILWSPKPKQDIREVVRDSSKSFNGVASRLVFYICALSGPVCWFEGQWSILCDRDTNPPSIKMERWYFGEGIGTTKRSKVQAKRTPLSALAATPVIPVCSVSSIYVGLRLVSPTSFLSLLLNFLGRVGWPLVRAGYWRSHAGKSTRLITHGGWSRIRLQGSPIKDG